MLLELAHFLSMLDGLSTTLYWETKFKPDFISAFKARFEARV